MRRALFLLLLLTGLSLAWVASARERIVSGLSQNRIAITANFDGSELLVFGAVQRFEPMPDTGPLGVIVTVTGPAQSITVWRKERLVGIWVNAEAVEVDKAPSFYAVATSAPLAQMLTGPEDHRYGISVERRIRSVSAPETVEDTSVFVDALLRLREAAGFYQTLESTVDLREDTLFRTRIELPANLVEGDYQARIFLMRDQTVIDSEASLVSVRKVGLERQIFVLAHEHPLFYGLLSVFLAVVAGWGAAAALGRMRG